VSDQPAPEQQTEDRPVTSRDLDDLKQALHGAFKNVFEQQKQLAERLPSAPTGQPTVDPSKAVNPADFKQRIHDDFLNTPERVLLDTAGLGAELAVKQIKKELAAEREQTQLNERFNKFFGDFYAFGQNSTLRPFHDQIVAHMQRAGVDFADCLRRTDIETLSRGVEWAAEQVRTPLTQIAQVSSEQERRQRADRRFAAGTPGSQPMPETSQKPADEQLTREERVADYFEERQRQSKDRRHEPVNYAAKMRLVKSGNKRA